ncbi:MAG: hypothetical protein IPO63_13285 [Bacteroidetes bacterium]|nr:hypothetical protein [Bacteroidota bacterium]
MKKLTLSVTSSQRNPEIEKLILLIDKELKELAQKNAQHFAKSDNPKAEDASLDPYTNDIRTGYEALQAKVLHKLQPATHFPEASIDADHLKEKDKQLDIEIRKNEDQNKKDEYELGNFRPSSIKGRLRLTVLLTLILTIGETIFNAISFSVLGENLLFSLFLSLTISVAALVLAHFSAFLFKSAKSTVHKWLIAFVTLLIVSALFSALAVFRANYLEYHQVHISPVYFFIFNIFSFS